MDRTVVLKEKKNKKAVNNANHSNCPGVNGKFPQPQLWAVFSRQNPWALKQMSSPVFLLQLSVVSFCPQLIAKLSFHQNPRKCSLSLGTDTSPSLTNFPPPNNWCGFIPYQCHRKMINGIRKATWQGDKPSLPTPSHKSTWLSISTSDFYLLITSFLFSLLCDPTHLES